MSQKKHLFFSFGPWYTVVIRKGGSNAAGNGVKIQMKRKFFAFATVICMLCALTLCASAAGFYGENASGDHQGSLFVSGYSVTSSANVDGIAFLAGENVLSTGSTEYIAAAARTVTVEGDVEKDAFTAGQILSVKGDVGRDLFAAGQSLDFAGDVGGTVYAAGDTIVIRGNVAGDAFLSAETIVIDGNASIGGRLHYPANAKITADATILSNAIVEEAEPEMEEEANKGTGFGDKVVDKVLLFAGLSVVALVLLWLTPLWETVDSRYTGKPFSKYAVAFGIGFGTLVGAPLAAILLMISRVGMRLACVLLMVYIAALVVSCMFIAFFIGSLLWRKALKKAPKLWAELLIGTAAWTLVSCIPVVSFLAGLVGVPFGLGMVTLLITGAKARKVPEVPELPESTEE